MSRRPIRIDIYLTEKQLFNVHGWVNELLADEDSDLYDILASEAEDLTEMLLNENDPWMVLCRAVEEWYHEEFKDLIDKAKAEGKWSENTPPERWGEPTRKLDFLPDDDVDEVKPN